ncbi:hypothetical protein [Streptomyces longwoodensis]|uniref:hypothetical protein n=1 Tax=Streptomyces longwoodensis TaxID=68231 RepID=UPI0033D56865
MEALWWQIKLGPTQFAALRGLARHHTRARDRPPHPGGARTQTAPAGLTAEEQALDGDLASRLTGTVTPEAHPTLARHDIMAHLVRDDFDQRFAFGIRRLLAAER